MTAHCLHPAVEATVLVLQWCRKLSRRARIHIARPSDGLQMDPQTPVTSRVRLVSAVAVLVKTTKLTAIGLIALLRTWDSICLGSLAVLKQSHRPTQWPSAPATVPSHMLDSLQLLLSSGLSAATQLHKKTTKLTSHPTYQPRLMATQLHHCHGTTIPEVHQGSCRMVRLTQERNKAHSRTETPVLTTVALNVQATSQRTTEQASQASTTSQLIEPTSAQPHTDHGSRPVYDQYGNIWDIMYCNTTQTEKQGVSILPRVIDGLASHISGFRLSYKR